MNNMKKILTCAAVVMASSLSFNAFAGGNIAAGKAITEKSGCAACHGADFNSPIDPSYPKLAGQHQDYITHALTAYKRGDGANGRNNAIMDGQVKVLSEQDIKDVAAYLHSLPGSLVVRR